jgi:hypothetical protein
MPYKAYPIPHKRQAEVGGDVLVPLAQVTSMTSSRMSRLRSRIAVTGSCQSAIASSERRRRCTAPSSPLQAGKSRPGGAVQGSGDARQQEQPPSRFSAGENPYPMISQAISPLAGKQP